MTDDELRRALANSVPLPGDVDTEAALIRARARGRQRHRQRRWMTMAAPAGAASAAVAIVLIAHAGSTSHAPPVTSTPTPTPTAVGLGVGQWYRHVTGVVQTSTGPVDLSAVWVVRLSSATRGTFEARPTSRFGPGTLTYDAVRRLWVVTGLRQCGGVPGTYRLARAGSHLTFTHVSDPCVVRATVLDNNAFAPLTDPDQLNG
jgi:hypothetical protein